MPIGNVSVEGGPLTTFIPAAARKGWPVASPPRGKYVKTPAAFQAWLQAAPPGGQCCYWQGHLGVAREGFIYSRNASLAWQVCRHAEAMGSVVWEAYEAGKVLLVQRRHPLIGFTYLAFKRATPIVRSFRRA